jgi:cytochrome b561
MQANNSPTVSWRYSTPAVVLHWLLALLIVGLVGLGWYMVSLESQPTARWWRDLHRSIGMAVFVLVLLRLLWRLSHKPEPLPAAVPAWQARLARTTQALLYAVMVALPLLGLVGTVYSRSGLVFFGAALPRLAAPDRAASDFFYAAHSWLSWVLVALVVLHVAGGLKHLLVDRDGVFGRMWPARGAS